MLPFDLKEPSDGVCHQTSHQSGILPQWIFPASLVHHEGLPVDELTDAAVQRVLGIRLTEVRLRGDTQHWHGTESTAAHYLGVCQTLQQRQKEREREKKKNGTEIGGKKERESEERKREKEKKRRERKYRENKKRDRRMQ